MGRDTYHRANRTGVHMSKPDAAQAPATVIGLGLMGQALAAAFLKEGHPATVWNRSPGKAEQHRA